MNEFQSERKKDTTAVIMMMGVLSEKLTELSRILIRIDEKSTQLLSYIKNAIEDIESDIILLEN